MAAGDGDGGCIINESRGGRHNKHTDTGFNGLVACPSQSHTCVPVRIHTHAHQVSVSVCVCTNREYTHTHAPGVCVRTGSIHTHTHQVCVYGQARMCVIVRDTHAVGAQGREREQCTFQRRDWGHTRRLSLPDEFCVSCYSRPVLLTASTEPPPHPTPPPTVWRQHNANSGPKAQR